MEIFRSGNYQIYSACNVMGEILFTNISHPWIGYKYFEKKMLDIMNGTLWTCNGVVMLYITNIFPWKHLNESKNY